MPYKPFHNRAGERYGRLVVTRYAGISNHSRVWECLCDCGNECTVSWKQIQQNHKTSCGCRQEETRKSYGEQAGANRKTTGESAFNQLFYNYKKSARERGYSFDLAVEHFRSLVESPCFYCGAHRPTKAARAKGTNGDYFYTGIDRIDNARGYMQGNVRPCCKQCNIAKGTLTEAEFYSWINRIAAMLPSKVNP